MDLFQWKKEKKNKENKSLPSLPIVVLSRASLFCSDYTYMHV